MKKKDKEIERLNFMIGINLLFFSQVGVAWKIHQAISTTHSNRTQKVGGLSTYSIE